MKVRNAIRELLLDTFSDVLERLCVSIFESTNEALDSRGEPGLGVLGDTVGLSVTFLVLALGVGLSMLGVLLLWAYHQEHAET